MSSRSVLAFSPGAAGPSLKLAADAGWRNRSACRTEDPELFFGAANEDAAKAVCSRCPVVGACLDLALALDMRDGVFGGLTEDERQPLHDAHTARLLRAGRKFCAGHGEVRPLAEFSRHSTAADGYRSNCNACRLPAVCCNGHRGHMYRDPDGSRRCEKCRAGNRHQKEAA